MGSLSQASQQGLSERFDSSIGAASVLMPYGGHFQKTRTDGMAAKLPVRQGDTDTVSFMTHGYDPDLASWSPFHGAVYAVLLSLARIMALGGNWRKSYLTLQEYFEKLTDEKSWGKPAAALLGALTSFTQPVITATIAGPAAVRLGLSPNKTAGIISLANTVANACGFTHPTMLAVLALTGVHFWPD